jgi:hypothetical protein
MERRERTYGITIYRDEPDEAAVVARFVGTAEHLRDAVSEARAAARGTGWPMWSATVDDCYRVTRRTRDGIDLVSYEDPEPGEPEARHWGVGPDWCQRQ